MAEKLIYVITDHQSDFEKMFERTKRLLDLGIHYLQYRQKNVPMEQMLGEAAKLLDLTKQYQVPLIINDSVALCGAVGAQGVHLGQFDQPPKEAREKLGTHAIIGVTAKTVAQGVMAEKTGAAYIGVGALFPSSTKPEAVKVNEESLMAIKSAVTIPIIGIGGIVPQRLNDTMINCCDGFAIVSLAYQNPDYKNAIKKLKNLSK